MKKLKLHTNPISLLAPLKEKHITFTIGLDTPQSVEVSGVRFLLQDVVVNNGRVALVSQDLKTIIRLDLNELKLVQRGVAIEVRTNGKTCATIKPTCIPFVGKKVETHHATRRKTRVTMRKVT